MIEIELEQSILQKPFHVATIQVVNHSKPLLTISSIMDVPLDFSTEFYHWYMNRKLDITIEQP